MKTIRLFFLLAGLIIWCSGCGGNMFFSKKAAPAPKITSHLNMAFVYIPSGTFVMGSPAYETGRFDDEIRQKVTLTKGFYIQTTEVTQGQWEAVMVKNPSHFEQCGKRCPVENVSWNDAQEFIRRLNEDVGGGKYRLPTEAEWEYVCRLGQKKNVFSRILDAGVRAVNVLYFSVFEEELMSSLDCLSTDEANYNGQLPCAGCPKGEYRDTTLPAGSLAPNKLGIYDMTGNVYEWCLDHYCLQQCASTFPLNKISDPVGDCNGKFKVYRGGSWMSCFRYCRPAYRGKARPDYSAKNIGFRLVKEPH